MTINSRRARASVVAALALAAGTCLPSVGMYKMPKSGAKPRKYVSTTNTNEINEHNKTIEAKRNAKKQMKMRKFAFDSDI